MTAVNTMYNSHQLFNDVTLSVPDFKQQELIFSLFVFAIHLTWLMN